MTDWGSVADWVGAGAQVLAAFGTGFVLWQTRRTIEIADRSENTKIFMDFSDRYDKIKSDIPRAFLVYWPTLEEAFRNPTINNPQAINKVIELLDLFDKQHFLFSKGFVEKDLWEKVWLVGIKKNFKNAPINYVLIQRYSYDNEHKISDRFVKFLRDELNVMTE